MILQDLLLAAGSLASELIVRLATPGVDTAMFSSLLRFLYTGDNDIYQIRTQSFQK